MPGGLNLIKKAYTFNSQMIKGLNVKISNYKIKGSTIPRIESNTINSNSKAIAEFSSKRFDNGNRFEVYRQTGNILKVLRNKFGEILSFKFNGAKDSHILTPENIIENTRNDFENRLKNIISH